MSWAAMALWTLGLVAAAALSRLVLRLVWAFVLAAAVLLLLHAQQAPGEAMLGFGVLGGGLLLLRPARRIAAAAGLIS